jgi:hypothetical protein
MANYPVLADLRDIRYNPFSDTYDPKGYGYDSGVDPEERTVPVSSPYFIPLFEYPKNDTPSTVSIYNVTTDTTLTEVDETVNPANNQFRVHYEGERAGLIEFNSAQAGDEIEISYYGLGHNAMIAAMFAPYNQAVDDIETKYGGDTEFEIGLAGGSGSTILEQIGKSLYDDLYVKSEDGGYAANELLAYKDATGRIAKTTNALIKRISDGDYGGTGDNDVPSENRIGDTTDFETGQGGSSGGSAHQQLGYYVRENTFVNSSLFTPLGVGNYTTHIARAIDIDFGVWTTIGHWNVGDAVKHGWIHVVLSSFHDMASVSFSLAFAIREDVSRFRVCFCPETNCIDDPENYVQARVIISNDTTDRGGKLQIKVFNSSTANTIWQVRTCALEYVSTFIPDNPYEDNTPDLPSGDSFASFGQASDDWWAFRQGATELWNGSETITTGNNQNILPFTGFDSEMFNAYAISCAVQAGAETEFAFLPNYNNLQKVQIFPFYNGLTIDTYFRMKPNNTNGIYVDNQTGNTMYVYGIYGIN